MESTVSAEVGSISLVDDMGTGGGNGMGGKVGDMDVT